MKENQIVARADLEKEDIQGLLIRGYSNLNEACFILLNFSGAEKSKAYISSLAGKIVSGEKSPTDFALHFAITNAGLKALHTSEETYESFSRQFKEGMTDEHRSFVLGDYEDNAPANWKWGAPQQQPVHAMLMIYAKDKNLLEQVYQNEKTNFQSKAIGEILRLDCLELKDSKEHFGFQDGISQPTIKELMKEGSPIDDNVINGGEFILGYKNMYDQYTTSPYVFCEEDPTDILLGKKETPALKDLGKNGSYLVFRQMSQDVFSFWKYMKENSREKYSGEDPAITLASKMVGRWPSGASLVTSPDKNDPDKKNQNDFGYFKEDHEGLKCPFGAHVRRANPRDHLRTEESINVPKENQFAQKQSSEMVQKHRLLRRGRTYGDPVSANMDIHEIMSAAPDNKERGIYFMCFAGDLVRQFEFVQNSWMKFHKFAGLNEDSDPIAGTRKNDAGMNTTNFTVQAEPIRRRYKNLSQFVRVVGGAYFFFPGIRAMKYLGAMK